MALKLTGLCSTNVSIEILQQELQKAFKTDAEIAKWSAERTGGGQGYLSTMVKLKLEWSKDFPSSQEVQRVVLKVPNTAAFNQLLGKSSDHGTDVHFDKNMTVLTHNTEVKFYKTFMGVEAPLPLAKCFIAEAFEKNSDKPAYLLFEDLSLKGHIVLPHKGFTLNQCYQLLEMTANLHAYYLNNPSVWQTTDGRHFADMDDLAYGGQMVKGMVAGALAAMEMQVDLFGAERLAKLKSHLNSGDYTCQRAHNVDKELNMTPVLVHNDTHTTNVFLKGMAGEFGDPDVLCIIDWQFAFLGPAAYGIFMILVYSSNSDVWRPHTLELCKSYYDTLTGQLKSGKAPFTFDQLMKSLDLIKRCSVGICTAFLLGARSFQTDGTADQAKAAEHDAILVQHICDIIDDFAE